MSHMPYKRQSLQFANLTEQQIASPAPATSTAEQPWQQSLKNLITDAGELLRMLELDAPPGGVSPEVLKQFPVKVPREFARRMRPGDPNDPLLRQVLPLGEEEDHTAGFTIDPLSEADFNPQPGILHKYQGRILLMAAPHCAIHCRYCFRRHFPYDANTPGRQAWEQSLQWIADNPQISEVIYSGGDPLAASDRHLAWLTEKVSGIPHVSRLRIHTRVPVVIPSRVDDALIDWLDATRLQTVMVIHANHADEIDQTVVSAMQRLRQSGVTLLNQSVLLKGVNDSADALVALSEKLFSAGVLPYYLHLLDKVQGVAHFDVSASRARELVQEIRGRLPGYLVPRLVAEIAGQPAKTPLSDATDSLSPAC